jgi:hypothetical protein
MQLDMHAMHVMHATCNIHACNIDFLQSNSNFFMVEGVTRANTLDQYITSFAISGRSLYWTDMAAFKLDESLYWTDMAVFIGLI